MIHSKFIYSLRQKIIYHLSVDPVRKRIAEINQPEKKIEIRNKNYFITDIGLLIPPGKYDFVFSATCFNKFVSNCKSLNGRYEIKNNRLVFHFDDLTFNITNKSDLNIIEEVFIKACYNFYIPGKYNFQVIDIGMNVGISSIFFSTKPRVSKIYAFEPFIPTFQSAMVNMSLNREHSMKIVPFNFGLGLRPEHLSVPFDPENPGINSTLIKNPRIQTENTEKVEIRSADSVISEILAENNETAFVVKIDVEGAEYDIMTALGKNKIPDKIKIMIIEWHFRGPEELQKILLHSDFKIISTVLNENAGLIYAVR